MKYRFTFILVSYLFLGSVNCYSEITNSKTVFTFSENKADLQWDLPEHSGALTERVMYELGWKNEQAKIIVVSSNLYTDILDKGLFASRNYFNPGANFTAGIVYYKYSDTYASQIINLMCNYTIYVNCIIENSPFNKDYAGDLTGSVSLTKGFHFDNLFTYSQICERWKELDDWVKEEGRRSWESLAQCIEKSDKREIRELQFWLCLIGMVTHAVQDFYCHSNWITLTNYYGTKSRTFDPDSLPIWEEISDSKWLSNHANFDVMKVMRKFKQSNMEVSSEEFKERGMKHTLSGGLQTGNCNSYLFYCGCFDVPKNSGIYPWDHRHPGSRSCNENKILKKIFKNDSADTFEYLAGIVLAKRATKWWITYLTSNLILDETKLDYLMKFVFKENNCIYDCEDFPVLGDQIKDCESGKGYIDRKFYYDIDSKKLNKSIINYESK